MLWMSSRYHQQVIPHLGGFPASLTPKVVLRSRPTWAPAESTFPGGPRWRRGYRLRDSHMFENSIRATTLDGDLSCESGFLRPGSCQKAVFRRLCVTEPAAAPADLLDEDDNGPIGHGSFVWVGRVRLQLLGFIGRGLSVIQRCTVEGVATFTFLRAPRISGHFSRLGKGSP